MRHSRQLTPFPAETTQSPGTSVRKRWRRLSPLARDIVVILLAKAIVLCLLWFAFFRVPAAPGMAMDPLRVEQKFLAPAPFPEPRHAIR